MYHAIDPLMIDDIALYSFCTCHFGPRTHYKKYILLQAPTKQRIFFPDTNLALTFYHGPPKVEGHSFAGEVITMSSMKLGIRQTAQNTPLTTFWLAVSQLQTAQLHCCNSRIQPAQRLAHSAAGRSLAPMQQSVWERGINTR